MSKTLFIIKKFIPNKIFKKLQPIYHFIFGYLAAYYYRFPSERIIVIGVTGTTGKTTVVYLIAEMLKNAGFKVGYTSTALFSDGDKEWLNDKKMTMVGRFFTQRMLSNMVRNKCQYAIVETTSEGVVQFRHRFINYDLLVCTGLYPEHIESHGSFENYKNAKGKLFAHLKKCKTKYADNNNFIIKTKNNIKKLDLARVKKSIIVNGDSEYAEYFLDFWAEEKIAFKLCSLIELADDKKTQKNADQVNIIKYGDLATNKKGLSFKFIAPNNKKIEIESNMLGEFNAANMMSAICLGILRELPMEKIRSGIEDINGVPGRLEKINAGQDFAVIVDYAFEPNALKKLYEVVDSMEHNKIIHVLGSAGGGRDIARRPKLGEIAGQYADYVIITNEDPYDDDPEIIIDQVSFGAEKSGKQVNKNLFKILDRREAIQKALSLAKKGDIVLITGKGSEQAICVKNGEKIPWDDRIAVKEEIAKII